MLDHSGQNGAGSAEPRRVSRPERLYDATRERKGEAGGCGRGEEMGTGAVRANERCDCMDIHGFDPSVPRDARTAAEEHASFSDTNGFVRLNEDEVGNKK